MNTFKISGIVQRFPGEHGWHYVELEEKLSKDFRPIIKEKWPALLGATFTIKNTTWKSSIMPLKNGPLFIALPAKVRKAEDIGIDQRITIKFVLR
jgi:hypothetical protein